MIASATERACAVSPLDPALTSETRRSLRAIAAPQSVGRRPPRRVSGRDRQPGQPSLPRIAANGPGLRPASPGHTPDEDTMRLSVADIADCEHISDLC